MISNDVIPVITSCHIGSPLDQSELLQVVYCIEPRYLQWMDFTKPEQTHRHRQGGDRLGVWVETAWVYGWRQIGCMRGDRLGVWVETDWV